MAIRTDTNRMAIRIEAEHLTETAVCSLAPDSIPPTHTPYSQGVHND